MKNRFLLFSFIFALVVVLFTCTKDTVFNPTDIQGITIAAYVCDITDVDTTITITDSLSGTVTALSVYAGQTITFLGFIKGDSVSDITWSWDFGDTVTSASRIVEHRYLEPREYKAVFTITNGVGVSLSDTVSVSAIQIVADAAIRGYAYLEGKAEHNGIQIVFIDKISSGTICLKTEKNGYFDIISHFPHGEYNVCYNDTLFNNFTSVSIKDVLIVEGILTELGRVVLEDNYQPHITNRSPTGTIYNRKPLIEADFKDTASGIAHKTFLLVFGSDTIADSLISCDSSGFSWTPEARLPDGSYPVHASICDSAGNMDSITWSFTIDALQIKCNNDTTISINDTVLFSAVVSGVWSKVVEYGFDFNGDSTWDKIINTNDTAVSQMYIFTNDNIYYTYAYAKDDGGKVKYDTVIVDVKLDPPVAVITAPDSARLDSSFTLSCSLSTPGEYGYIVKYEWSIGAYDNFQEASGNDTVIYTTSEETDSFIIVLRVIDDDNNMVLDTDYIHISSFWEVVGTKGFSDSYVDSISFAIGDNFIPYVLYADNANSQKATVMKYDDSAWEPVGKKGISDGIIGDVSISVGSNNLPYIAYKDVANDNKATVMKFNGTLWEFVGNKGFSDGSIWDISLAIDGNNVPYIAYKDGANGSEATVMKYSNSSWEPVGDKGFSDALVCYVSIVIDGTNIPYVAYGDNANGDRATVMKFNGTAWEPVGVKGFSDGYAGDISLAIDNSNMPWVAYRDNANGNKVTVMKFNGTAWEPVGYKGFSDGLVENVSIAIDDDNIPYVAYQDDANSDKATVLKFNGNSWGLIGNKGFSDGTAYYILFALNKKGTPYVAYNDGSIGGKVTVMRYR